MAFVHADSCEYLKSELDLFNVPPTQTSVETGTFVEYHLITNIRDGSPLEFDVQGTGSDYIDLANCLLYVKAKVTQANDADLAANTQVAPVSLFLHSLFSQVEVSLNGTPIASPMNTYPYRAYLESLLSYGADAKSTHLTSALYYKDTAGKMDGITLDGNQMNQGFKKRHDFIEGSRSVDMIGRIHSDIFFQQRYLINEVNLKVKLIRSRDVFCLMGNNDYKSVIENAILYVRKVKLSPPVFLAQMKALESGTAKYPIRRVACKTVTIPRGYFDISQEKLFSGQLPSRIVIGLVRNDAFSGIRTRNPLNFQNFDLKEIGVYSDGQQQHGFKPLTVDFENNLYIRAFNTLFSGTGKLFQDERDDLNRSEYANGYALYAFNLTSDQSDDEHFDLVRHGSIRLQLKFGTPTLRL